MQPKVTYKSTRLHFKAAEIEPLASHEEFRVVTGIGTWQMSKANFYKVFPNVVVSESYSGARGEYHYTNPPVKANQFRVQTQATAPSQPARLEDKLRDLESKIRSPFQR